MRGNFFATIDCKTVRTFAYSSTREQSNKRYGARRETESETGESRAFGDRALRAREALTPLLRYTKPILRKKTRLFCSLLLQTTDRKSPFFSCN